MAFLIAPCSPGSLRVACNAVQLAGTVLEEAATRPGQILVNMGRSNARQTKQIDGVRSRDDANEASSSSAAGIHKAKSQCAQCE